MVITYFTLCAYMAAIGVGAPFLNAIVPTVGFNLSTWSLPWVKQIWMGWVMAERGRAAYWLAGRGWYCEVLYYGTIHITDALRCVAWCAVCCVQILRLQLGKARGGPAPAHQSAGSGGIREGVNVTCSCTCSPSTHSFTIFNFHEHLHVSYGNGFICAGKNQPSLPWLF